MKSIVTVDRLKEGDRFEFLTKRSEWADNCYLTHPQGVVVVARAAFLDPYQQCRFGWRLEKFPGAKPQDWWGQSDVKVRLLGAALATAEVEATRPNRKSPASKGQRSR